MKKLLFFLTALLAVVQQSSAQMTPVVTVADVEAVPGETVAFSLNLTGGKVDKYTALQFDVQFPAMGFSTTGAFTVNPIWSGVSAVIGDVDASGVVTVPFASANTIPVADVEDLVTVSFTVDNFLPIDEYDVTLKNLWFGYNSADKDYLENVIFKVKVVERHTVVLNETDTEAPTDATDVNVTVKRTINANEWSTICLPFAMTAEQVTAAFGSDVQLADFKGYDATEDNDEIVGITVNFEAATAIAANHPYIIKVTSNVSEFSVESVDIAPEENPSVSFGKTTGSGKNKVYHPSDFNGTYVADFDFYNEAVSYPLFLSGNKFYYATEATKHMKAFRAYFDFDDYLAEAEGASSRISMTFGNSTGIHDNKRETINNDRYYDLQGRRVSESVIRNSEMKKGLYIVNGKKVIK